MPESNLPKWKGAAEVYIRAYALLERIARAGHVARVKRGRKYQCEVSEDMRQFIDALNRGDESEIKALMLRRLDYADSVRLVA